jgi:hypothetical protein
MTRYLQSHWAVALVGTLLYLATTLLTWRLPDGFAPISASPPPTITLPTPSWEFSNPELDQLLLDLREESLSLAKRHRQLDELAARLQLEQSELTNLVLTIEQLQRNFDSNVIRFTSEETVNLKKLAKLYTSMDPASAAIVLQELEDDGVVKVLSLMKEIDTAAILQILAGKGETEVRRVAALSERLRLVIPADPVTKVTR